MKLHLTRPLALALIAAATAVNCGPSGTPTASPTTSVTIAPDTPTTTHQPTTTTTVETTTVPSRATIPVPTEDETAVIIATIETGWGRRRSKPGSRRSVHLVCTMNHTCGIAPRRQP